MPALPHALGSPGSWAARWRSRVFGHAPADGAGVRLRHSRIYILPSRRGVALIATIATIVVTSLNYGLALGLVVAFLLTGLVGAALLHTFRNLAGLDVKPGGAGEAFAGGRVTFQLALHGGARTRAAIALTTRDRSTQVADVQADVATPIAVEIEAPSRGRVPLGRIVVTSDFPLGLWRAWAYAHFPVAGIAYPAPELAAPPIPAGATGETTGAKGFSDDADLTGLRTYQHGDPPQRVAWKAVARRAGWYTKHFEGAGHGGPVVLDFATLPTAMTLEQKLSRLCAWVLACEHAARPYGLALPRMRIAVGKGRDHRRAVLTALALVEGNGQ